MVTLALNYNIPVPLASWSMSGGNQVVNGVTISAANNLRGKWSYNTATHVLSIVENSIFANGFEL